MIFSQKIVQLAEFLGLRFFGTLAPYMLCFFILPVTHYFIVIFALRMDLIFQKAKVLWVSSHLFFLGDWLKLMLHYKAKA